MFWNVIILILTLIVAVGAFVFFARVRKNFNRTLNLAFLSVTMPRKDSDLDEKKETQRDFKETISLMEQLLASLKAIYSKKIYSKLFGQEIFSLEYIAHEGQVLFYVVIPKQYKDLFEKQINSFYPDAIIEETEEINIFKGKKYTQTTYLHLNKKFFYPIKTYQKLESDPINNITNALSKLDDDESAAIQIVLKPVLDDWQKASADESSMIMAGKTNNFTLNPFKLILIFFKLLFTANTKDGSPLDSSKDKTSALSQERAKTVDEKGDKTGYEVCVRVVTAGNNKNTIDNELINIISSFSQFNYPDFNGFTNTLRHSSKAFLRNFIFRNYQKPAYLYFDKEILNTEEIASIFHFPHSKYNKSSEIKWQNFKVVSAPKEIPKDGILLGHNVYRGVKKEIKILNEDRFRHFYVIGKTGTGKSSILQVMGRQDLEQGHGMAVIDPHGDLVSDLLPFVPRHRADDVIVFNPADTSRPLGLNILEAHSDDEKELVAQDAMNIMIKLFGSEIFGPRLQDYFRNGALTLMDYPDGGALTDMVRLFTDDAYQQDRIKHVKNPIVKAWWESTFANMGDREKKEIIPYFSAKFGQFITNSTMRNIIGQVDSSFNVFDAMQESKILMINLSKGELGDINSELLGLILVSKVQMAAMRRQKIPKEERKDFFMYIDEFQNYITPSIESILSEARKYRLGLILANQYLGQLEKSDALTKSSVNLKNAIFGNVGSIMSYSIGNEDGEFMSKYYAPTFSEQDLINMDKFKAVMKLSVENQPTRPFSIIPVNPYLVKGDDKLAKAYVELSRLKYGRDKTFVDKEIKYRIGNF